MSVRRHPSSPAESRQRVGRAAVDAVEGHGVVDRWRSGLMVVGDTVGAACAVLGAVWLRIVEPSFLLGL